MPLSGFCYSCALKCSAQVLIPICVTCITSIDLYIVKTLLRTTPNWPVRHFINPVQGFDCFSVKLNLVSRIKSEISSSMEYISH